MHHNITELNYRININFDHEKISLLGVSIQEIVKGLQPGEVTKIAAKLLDIGI
ncbi:hypothetical protein [Calothrix sp. UHCC 0171]|uniref:hypothetical protein n=1 Tax=Calothrix sp. UHCC 0171 TaxID=3110245 RepID=UPI002B1FCBB3|nr:hypothetical protein [Calothrix sp. UHCC 0171]MEA5571488.1 hypothetical protein [Calothrix sp. UHCC 0171]